MRNRKGILSLLLVSTFMTGALSLSAAVDEMNVTTVDELRTCLSDSAEKVCVVKNDITLNEVDANGYFTRVVGTKTLELGEFKIERTADTRVATALVYVGGSESSSAKLTVNATAGGIETGDYTIAPLGLGEYAEIVVNGGTYVGSGYGISGNGTKHNTKVTVNGGTIKGGQVGIYHPQIGTLTVNGGIIEGGTGIEMRSGTLVVNGGVIKSNATTFSAEANGNGNSTEGAGIAVAQHTTKNSIDVTVKAGDIRGYIPFYQGNVQSNSEEDVAKISLSIEGGTFTSTNTTDSKAVSVENVKNFISGGTFVANTKPSAEDLVEGLYISDNGEVDSYKVTLEYDDSLASATMTPENPKPGDVVTIQFTLNDSRINGYSNSAGVVLKELGNNKYQFTMPEKNVILSFYVTGFETSYFVYTDAMEQDMVNEWYEESQLFNMYFDENALDVMKDTLASLVKDIEDKYFSLYSYASAYEFDFAKYYEDMPEESKEFYDNVKKLLPSGNTIIGSAYIGVNVWDNENNEELVTIDELNDNVKISLQLPDAYEGKSKYYGLARVVDGKLEVIRGTLSSDGKTVVFNTNKLGEFVFLYGDIANPNTYDAGISSYVVLGSISLVALVALSLVAKKKVFNK